MGVGDLSKGKKGKKKRDNVGIWVEGGKEVILVCSLVTTDMWRYIGGTCFTVPNYKNTNTQRRFEIQYIYRERERERIVIKKKER